jgi:hypothetical protein
MFNKNIDPTERPEAKLTLKHIMASKQVTIGKLFCVVDRMVSYYKFNHNQR